MHFFYLFLQVWLKFMKGAGDELFCLKLGIKWFDVLNLVLLYSHVLK